MSMIERALYWLAIVVLILGIVGLKTQISELEKKMQTAQSQVIEEGGEE